MNRSDFDSTGQPPGVPNAGEDLECGRYFKSVGARKTVSGFDTRTDRVADSRRESVRRVTLTAPALGESGLHSPPAGRRRVRADGAELVAGRARSVCDREAASGIVQRLAQNRVRRVDQDRADGNATISHH